jgi:hypothetical protein
MDPLAFRKIAREDLLPAIRLRRRAHRRRNRRPSERGEAGVFMNLPNIAVLEAPVVSIGGAGTFDGVFLTGIIAGLLA